MLLSPLYRARVEVLLPSLETKSSHADVDSQLDRAACCNSQRNERLCGPLRCCEKQRYALVSPNTVQIRSSSQALLLLASHSC